MPKTAEVESPTTWSKNYPKMPGAYRFRGYSPLTDDDEPQNDVVIFSEGKKLLVKDPIGKGAFDIDLFEGEWMGPLKPPK